MERTGGRPTLTLLRHLAKRERTQRDHGWTGSVTDRVMACPASAVMRQVHFTGRTSHPLQWGSGVHVFLYDYVTRGREEAIARLPSWAPWTGYCQALDLGPLLNDMGNVDLYGELALAYNPVSKKARVLGTGLDRDYPNSPYEVCLTTDLVGIQQEGNSGFVYDYKTGAWDGRPAEAHGQLLLAACAVAAAYRLKSVYVGLVHFDEAGSFCLRKAWLESEELEQARALMLRTWQQMQASREELTLSKNVSLSVGDHCRYCPCFRICPAQMRLAQELSGLRVPSDTWHLLYGKAPPPIRPEEVARAWLCLRHARHVLDEAEVQLRDHIAREKTVRYFDNEVSLSVQQRETIDGKKAAPVLREMLGDVADRVIEERVSKTVLEQVCRETGRDSAFVLERLRQMGACPVTETSQIRTRKIKETQA